MVSLGISLPDAVGSWFPVKPNAIVVAVARGVPSTLIADPPWTSPRSALQLEVDPPSVPEHDHVHGPEPETEPAEPELHRPTLGAEDTALPSLEPQTPSTGTAGKLAEQDALAPPSEPEHDHVHGPEPETELAEPELHSPTLGAEDTVAPSLEPQAPLTGADEFAEQLVDAPPFPRHVQVHGPLPWTAPSSSESSGRHRFELGALGKVPPLLVPHWPAQAVPAQPVLQSQANAISIQAIEMTSTKSALRKQIIGRVIDECICRNWSFWTRSD